MKYNYKDTRRKDVKAYDRDGRTFYAVFFRVKKYDGTTKQIHKHGFGSLKDAVRYMSDTKAKYDGKATVPLHVVAEDYMGSIEKSGFSPYTIASRKSQLKRILQVFGDFPICDITPLMVREWQEDLVKEVKPQSANYCKACLSCVFKYAMTYYGLTVNPAKLASNLRVKDSDKKEKAIWKDEDLAKALEHENDVAFRVLVQLLYYSGLRIGEALGLTPKDILEDGVMVRQQRTQFGITKAPKAGSAGKVLVHPDMMRILRNYVARTGIEKDSVFPYTYVQVKTKMRKLCEIADVPRITLHGLRHSSLTNDANRGVPLVALQAKARHRTATTTEKYYLHLDGETQSMLNFDYNVVGAIPDEGNEDK